MKKIFISAVMMLAFHNPGFAGELYGIEFPDQIQFEGQKLPLHGMGLRSVQRFGFKVKVCVIGLYLPEVQKVELKSKDKSVKGKEAKVEKESDKKAGIFSEDSYPKVFRMVFKRGVDSEDIEKGWKDSFKKNCSPDCEAEEPKLKKFNGMMSDMRSDQSIEVVVYKDKVHVDVKGRKPAKGFIEGERFARIIENIWLGPYPPNQELKDGLLGK